MKPDDHYLPPSRASGDGLRQTEPSQAISRQLYAPRAIDDIADAGVCTHAATSMHRQHGGISSPVPKRSREWQTPPSNNNSNVQHCGFLALGGTAVGSQPKRWS
jgi:hypothetical protein